MKSYQPYAEERRIDKYRFEEGYCQARKYSRNYSQDNFTFCYFDRDHLGNIRQVREVDGSREGTVIQSMDYYPFGAQFCHSGTDNNVQPYRYNGKEYDRMHGLNTYDYGARQYNPITARWDRVDPLSGDYYPISPYVYCRNNPIMRIDIGRLYDFEGINYWFNPVITVYPVENQRDDAIQDDYQAAHDAAVPIITVENIADLVDALSALQQKRIPFECLVANSHGNYNGFRIGSEKVDATSDLSDLKDFLKGKTIFIGACNVGQNEILVNQIAEDTRSTVIAPLHKIPVGYRYDGSNGLNILGETYIPYYSPAKYYRSNGNTSNCVTNVTIHKNTGINWDGRCLTPYM